MKKIDKQTVQDENENSVSFYREHGGIITSIKFSGKEILYFDEETFLNPKKSLRGGIPILFPNAGAVDNTDIFSLPRHGFARNLPWVEEVEESLFNNSLCSDNNTRGMYPYDFKYSFSVNFSEENIFRINQKIENTGNTDMPIASGLHPYFKVPHSEKDNIIFNFKGGDICKQQSEKWKNGEYISIQNPKISDEDSHIEIFIPGTGTLIFNIPLEYQYIWIWSEPGKDFICIEPVMRNLNGITDNPKIIEPGRILSFSIGIKLL